MKKIFDLKKMADFNLNKESQRRSQPEICPQCSEGSLSRWEVQMHPTEPGAHTGNEFRECHNDFCNFYEERPYQHQNEDPKGNPWAGSDFLGKDSNIPEPEYDRFASGKIFDLSKLAGSYTLPPLDTDKYPNREREGLEGPTRLQSGKVVYYDRREGKYYDPSVDMYIETDDYEAHAGLRPPGYRNNGPTPPPGGLGAGAPTT